MGSDTVTAHQPVRFYGVGASEDGRHITRAAAMPAIERAPAQSGSTDPSQGIGARRTALAVTPPRGSSSATNVNASAITNRRRLFLKSAVMSSTLATANSNAKGPRAKTPDTAHQPITAPA